ncbi:MAG: hypothetical protein IPP39_16735 [Chitinophagaceae bacterium]|nr:hypothetical protein [Chitinophagaceae bacterium]
MAASGVCPLYTTTTNVTINLFVPALLDCATPLNFSSPVALSATQAPNVWYTDRYAPNGFAISNDLGGSTLKHSINAADGTQVQYSVVQLSIIHKAVSMTLKPTVLH